MMDYNSSSQAHGSTGSASAPVEPIQRLIAYLHHAYNERGSNDLLLIPDDIVQSLSILPVPIKSLGVRELVTLLDGPSSCFKFHDSSLCCLILLFLNVSWSFVQEHGLFLLLDGISQITDTIRWGSQESLRSLAQKRKSLIGQKMLIPLLESFLEDTKAERLRRLSGQLVLELLCGSSENKKLLALGPESLRHSIGYILCYERDITLRYLAGSIIRELYVEEYDQNLFGNAETLDQLERFLKESELPESEWIEYFCSFVHENGYNMSTWIIKSIDLKEDITSENIILLTRVQESLVFIILSGRTTWQQPRFVDIPVHSITLADPCVFHEKTLDTDPHFKIKLRSGCPYIVRGKEIYVDSMSINFVCNSDPQGILKAISAATRDTLNVNECKTSSYSVGDEGNTPRCMSQIVVHLSDMDDVNHNITSPSGTSDAYSPAQTFCQSLLTRRSTSIVVKLDAGEDVTKKSVVLQSQCAVEESPFQRDISSKEILGDSPKKLEVHGERYGIDERCIYVECAADGIEAYVPTGDVEPEVFCSSKEYAETISQEEEKERINSEDHDGKCGVERDMHRDPNASPCDSAASLDPPQSQQQFHPDISGSLILRHSAMESILTGVPMESRTILDSQEEAEENSTMKKSEINIHSSSRTKLKTGPKIFSGGRIRQSFNKASVTDSVDWDEDLRVPESELELLSIKKTKKSPRQLLFPSATTTKKSGLSGRKKLQQRVSLPTPKTGISSSRKIRTSGKTPVQNTLASCRPRRAAADEAKVKISCDYNRNEDTDDDDIQDFTPDDNFASNDSFQFDQLKTSTPGPIQALIDKASNEEADKSIIDLTAVPDESDCSHQGEENLERDISPNHRSYDPASSDHNLPKIESRDTDTHLRVEEDRGHDVEGRGRLIGNKLAAALGRHAILSSQVDKGSKHEEHHQQPVDGDDQPLARKEQLAKISNQISEFMSSCNPDSALEELQETRGLLGESEVSEQSRPVDSKTVNKVPQENTKRDRRLVARSVNTGDARSIRLGSSEELPTHNDRDVSKPTESVSPKVPKMIGHPYAALIDERLHRKAHIINFTADGPRNQCEIRPLSGQKLTSLELQTDNKTGNQLKRKATVDTSNYHTRLEKRLRFDFGGSCDVEETMDSNSSGGIGQIDTLSSPSPLKIYQPRSSMVDENGSPRPLSRTTRPNRTSQGYTSYNREQKGITVPYRENCDNNPGTESSPLDFIEKGSGVEYKPIVKAKSAGNCLPKAPALFPPLKFNIDDKQNGGSGLSGPTFQKKQNPLSVSSKRIPEGGREKERPLPFIQRPHRDEGEANRALQPETCTNEHAQLSAFWDSISNANKAQEKTQSSHEHDIETEYNGDSTTESSPLVGQSESPESITLVEPDGEMQWGQLLRASHRGTLDILVDTSKRLVRHLVAEEDAVWDVLETYDHGCRRLIDQLTEAHNESLKTYEQQMTAIKAEYKEIREKALDRLKASDKEIKALPTLDRIASAMKQREKLLTRLQNFSTTYDAKLDALGAPEES